MSSPLQSQSQVSSQNHSQRTRDLNDLKRQALSYFSLNSDITKRVEDALNSLFYESPYDTYGYLSEYFVKFSKQMFITRLVAHHTPYYDSRFQPTFRLDLYVQDKNKEAKLLSVCAPCHAHELINDQARIQIIQDDDTRRSNNLSSLIEFVNQELNDCVRNYSPLEQDELDEKLSNMFHAKQTECLVKYLSNLVNQQRIKQEQEASVLSGETGQTASKANVNKSPASPKQKPKSAGKGGGGASSDAHALHIAELVNLYNSTHFHASHVEAFISKAICQSAALSQHKQLFLHLGEVLNTIKKNEKISMPIPMITVLQNGKGMSGKQNLIKEFILLPKPDVLIHEGIELISKVNKALRDNLFQSKTTPGIINRLVTELGSLTCPLETPQQGIDLIETVLTTTLGESASKLQLALNLSASEYYDADKSKYEIGLGAVKTNEELIEVYVELVNKNPRVVMLIEPFVQTDSTSWYKLQYKLANKCYVANNITFTESIDSQSESLISELQAMSVDLSKLLSLISPSHEQPVMPVNFYRFEGSITVSKLGKYLGEKLEKKSINGLSSGLNETEDSFLSDLSVANQVGFLRIGGFNRSERVAKVNRLIEIENYLRESGLLAENSGKVFEFATGFEIPEEIVQQINQQEEAAAAAAASKKTPKK